MTRRSSAVIMKEWELIGWICKVRSRKSFWKNIADWSHCDATTQSDKSDIVNSANTSTESIRHPSVDDVQR